MPIRQFQPSRTVQVFSPRYGSGYRIGGRLVLTAAHLLGAVGSSCELVDKRSFGKEEAQVVWKAQGSDIALVELPEKIADLEAITFGKLPEAVAGEKLTFQMYAYPLWARTQREENGSAAGGRQIEGIIYLSDCSPDGLLVLEPERLPPEVSSDGESEWAGASGAAIICDGLVIAVQRQHQNPNRPASLEASPLSMIYADEEWRRLLRKHGINPDPEIISFNLIHLGQLIAEDLRSAPAAASIEQLVERLQRDERIEQTVIQINTDNATGFQTLVNEGGVANVGIHLHDFDAQKLEQVLKAFWKSLQPKDSSNNLPRSGTVQASEQGDVASGKYMSTKATLSTNGLLTIETYSESKCMTEGLRGHVVVVVYDRAGNAIWVSQDHRCTTRGGTWDPSCSSSGTDSWFEQFPEIVGQCATSLDIFHKDEGLGNMVGNIRRAIKESTVITGEIKTLAGQIWV